MFSLLLKWFVGIMVLILLTLTIITYYLRHSPTQAAFLAGMLPNPAPSGMYDGKIALPNPFWLGKRFDDISNTGANVFKEGYSATNDNFPFATYPGKGLSDRNKDVLVIDYKNKGNPFWMSMIEDEIVQIDTDHYLGKLHLRFLPGHPFTLAFFKLSR